jgi:hypothetical protein
MDLTLDQRIDKAHAEAERVEDNVRQLEARIVKAVEDIRTAFAVANSEK